MRLRPLAVITAVALSLSAVTISAAPALAATGPSFGIVSTAKTPPNVVAIARSADGATLYTLVLTSPAAGREAIEAIDIASGALEYTVKLPHSATAIAVSPDGTTVYAAGNSDVVAVSTASHLITAHAPSSQTLTAKIAVAPDGSTIYLADAEGGIDMLAASSLALEHSITTPVLTSLAISPDGKTLYAASTKLSNIPVYAIDTATGAISTLATVPATAAIDAIESADGSTLYVLAALFSTVKMSGSIVPISTATGAVGTPIAISDLPAAGALSSNGSSLYVISAAVSGYVEHLHVIDTGTGAQTGSYSVDGEYGAVFSAASGTSYLVSSTGELAALGSAAALTVPAKATITGAVRVGSTVTAHATAWGPAPVALHYQWYDDAGQIAGATKASYKVVPSELGSHLTVVVTGTRTGYVQGYAVSKAAKIAAGKLVSKPAKIVGAAKVGSTLKVAHGTWPSGTKFSYKWYANGRAITGATKASYKVSPKLAGKKIIVKVTGSKTGYAKVTVASKAKLIAKAA